MQEQGIESSRGLREARSSADFEEAKLAALVKIAIHFEHTVSDTEGNVRFQARY